MKKAIQILFTFITFIAVFYFTFLIYSAISYSFFEDELPKWAEIISGFASLITACYLAFIVWKKSENKKPSQGSYILIGALGTGVLGFIIGFFGPMIFAPEANQGPLLGILITGPGGVVLGAIGGFIYWEIKKRKAKKELRSSGI